MPHAQSTLPDLLRRGTAFARLGQLTQAEAAFREALVLEPGASSAQTNLGNVLIELGRVRDALLLFESASQRGDAPPQALVGLGRALCSLGRHGEAAKAFDRAVGHPQAHARMHSQRCYASLLNPDNTPERIVSIHRAYDAAIAAPLSPSTPTFRHSRPLGRKLRIGYLSADFREHSVASFLEGVLAAHDRSAFDVTLYSDTLIEDSTTTRFRQLASDFRNVSAESHEKLAQICENDQIDMLVDLAGHMQPNRLPVFARRPAPVLLTYLGYPGTTGMSAFDGRLSDAWAAPEDDVALAGPEPLFRVPGGLFAYSPPPRAPAPVAAPFRSAANIIFGCMNDALKLNDQVLATWAEILQRVADSRLLLKSRTLSSPDIQATILAQFGAAGVAPNRLEFLSFLPSRDEHLQTYGRVDLALDTFPYAGATTTCEALYMGVPVLTLAGTSHAGRLGVSILSAVGLKSFISRTRSDYVDLAERYARSPELLPDRRLLRETVLASPLCDATRPTRVLEDVGRSLLELRYARPRSESARNTR